MTISCGRFRGHAIEEFPLSYIVTCLEHGVRDSVLATARCEEVSVRLGLTASPNDHRCHPSSEPRQSTSSVPRAESRAGAHPDVDGSHREMVRINQVAEWLRSVVRNGS
jgi:hypothetical protein